MFSTSSVKTFADFDAYQAAIRAGNVDVFVTGRGAFRAELTRIDQGQLWLQRGQEKLPRICHIDLWKERAPIFFLAERNQPSLRHSGIEICPGEILVCGTASTHDQQTQTSCSWAAMSLTPQDLASVGCSIAGRELTAPKFNRVIRPASALMTRLLHLHKSAGELARSRPHLLRQVEVARALEQDLLHAMISCLAEGIIVEMSPGARRHMRTIGRLEEFLAENYDRPLYLGEICGAIGVSERTLRICCQEHVGMGPLRYLWLRRMHLARRALTLADPATSTVSKIAMDHGFWELGRFSVEYRELFEESPSETLRSAGRAPPAQSRPSDLPICDSA